MRMAGRRWGVWHQRDAHLHDLREGREEGRGCRREQGQAHRDDQVYRCLK